MAIDENSVVVCAKCGKRLYVCKAIGRDFVSEIVRAKDFIPISDDIPQPVDCCAMLCPYCDKPYALPADVNGDGIILQLASGAYWPHLPYKQ